MNSIIKILAYIGTVTSFAWWLFKGMFINKSDFKFPSIRKQNVWFYNLELLSSEELRPKSRKK